MAAPFPSGSIFMLDEGVSGPAAAFDRTTGVPLGIDTTVGNCETGAILPTGTFAISALNASNVADAVQIYDPTFTLLATVPVPPHANLHPICGNTADRFYACSGSFGNTLTAYDQTGSVLGTWTISVVSQPVSGLVVDAGNLVAYFAQVVSGAFHLRRFDLVNNVGLTDLLTFPSTAVVTSVGWGLTLAGDILVAATDNGDTTGNVFRYSTSGSLLATYALDANPINGGEDVLLALDFVDPTTFWYRIDPDPTGDTCIFRQIRLSDGAQLHSFTEPMNGTDFQVDGYAPASCPFLILVSSGPPPPPPTPPPCAQPSNPLLGCAGDLPLPGSSGGTGCAGDVASPGV